MNNNFEEYYFKRKKRITYKLVIQYIYSLIKMINNLPPTLIEYICKICFYKFPIYCQLNNIS